MGKMPSSRVLWIAPQAVDVEQGPKPMLEALGYEKMQISKAKRRLSIEKGINMHSSTQIETSYI